MVVESLPGIGVSEEQQLQRLEELEKELQVVEKKRKEALKRKKELQQKLEEVIQTVAMQRPHASVPKVSELPAVAASVESVAPK